MRLSSCLRFMRSVGPSTFILLSGFLVACPSEEKSAGPSTSPNSNADNQGQGGEGEQTDGSDDGGSTDYGGGGDSTIYVVNYADEDVCWLYLALDGEWSEDLLVDVLAMDYYYWISGVPSGYIEMYAEGCEGSTWYGADDVTGDYSFLLYGGGGGGGSDTGGWDTGG